MIYLIVFVIWVLLMACAIAVVGGNARGCSRDCKQGRNCTRGQENGDA